MQTVELHDILQVSLRPSGGIKLLISGPQSQGIPTDGSNLVVRAITLTSEALGLNTAQLGVSVELVKHIPSQAGLGGGSSDAANAMLAFCRLFKQTMDNDQLRDIARQLGSDVPYFLEGKTALVEGTGESCRQIQQIFPDLPVLIAKGSQGVSTREAYQALDAITDRQPGHSTEKSLNRDYSEAPTWLHNDFQDIVSDIEPDVKRTLSLFEQAPGSSEGSPALLCGSGASVFKIHTRVEAAESDAAFLRSAGLTVFLTRILNTPS